MSDPRLDDLHAHDEIDLRELFQVLWNGKALITMVTGLAAMISVYVALSLPNIYQSTAILAPKLGGGTGGLSRLASQYGGLASLAGINLGGLGGDGMTKPAIAVEKLKSLSFFKQHLYEDLLIDLMAVESWDSNTRQLNYDDEIYDSALNKWLREVDPPRQAWPTAQEAHKVFVGLLAVSGDKQTGLVSASIEHQSPNITQQWVELTVSRVSEDLRSKDIQEAEESIKFLELSEIKQAWSHSMKYSLNL